MVFAKKSTDDAKRLSAPAESGLTLSLREQRLAHEAAQKAAGVWGDMSVGVIQRGNDIFVHYWKGASLSVHKLAAKRPKEIAAPDYEALCLWLKAGRYEGFTQSLTGWNVTLAEAQRLKAELIEIRAAAGERVVNAPA
jgi:hypothetical protein